jgi:recombination protein RecT
MATTADAKKALAEREQRKNEPSLIQLIERQKGEIARALPKHLNPDRLARIATTLLRQNPKLGQCTQASFLGALMTCAQLGLEPGPLGHAWILPYRNKVDDRWVMEATFQLGYKGVIELARRSGQLAKITARTVYSNEITAGQFTVDYEGADELIRHKPILIEERGDPVLYYAIAKLTSAEQIWAPLTPGEVELRHRQKSKSPDSPAWRENYESMAWKSCVVESRRWLPQSPELEQAIAHEGRIRTEISPEVLEMPVPEDSIDGEIVEASATGNTSPAEAGPNDWAETAQPAGPS